MAVAVRLSFAEYLFYGLIQFDSSLFSSLADKRSFDALGTPESY